MGDLGGDLSYCRVCWNFLPEEALANPGGSTCGSCKEVVAPEHKIKQKLVTKNKARAFKDARAVLADKDYQSVHRATIDEECPSCGAKELGFQTAQLRSADEGQTIFYHCAKCGYKSTLNS